MKALHQFIEYLTNEKRFSEHTIRAYREDIKSFYSFLDTELDDQVLKATNAKIRSWLLSFATQNLSPRTYKRKLSSLKSFYKFLIKQGLIMQNPSEGVITPKQSKPIPEFFSDKEMTNLFDYVVFTNDFIGVRDKLIFTIFYSTGMRLSELVNLSLDDVDFGLQQITVTGKRNKQRNIPVSNSLIADIKHYLAIRDEVVTKDSVSYLLLLKNGKPVYPRMVRRLVDSYLGQVTTSDKKNPHKLRHTFATHMLNSGADLNAVKELLGHANLAATEVYTHNTYEKLKNIYNQAHPRA